METNGTNEAPSGAPSGSTETNEPPPPDAIVTCGVNAAGVTFLMHAVIGGGSLTFELTDEMADALHAQLGAIRKTREQRAGRAVAFGLIQQAATWFGEVRETARKIDEDFEARMAGIQESLERTREAAKAAATPPPAG